MSSRRFPALLTFACSAIVFASLATGATVTSTLAAEFLVRPDGSGDYPSIQAKENLPANTDLQPVMVSSQTGFTQVVPKGLDEASAASVTLARVPLPLVFRPSGP